MIKPQRIVDRKLLTRVRKQRCTACFGDPPSDADHIKTKGSGGGDLVDNVWPLCRFHHQERHRMGLGHMISKYSNCKVWMLKAGRQDVFERIQERVL